MTSISDIALDYFQDTMAANLFSSGGGSTSAEPLVEEGIAAATVVGTSAGRFKRNVKLYGSVDVVRGLSRPLGFSVTTDFAMDKTVAGRVMEGILKRCALLTEPDEIRLAFIDAMQLCAAINGTSLLNPGRSTFTVRLRDGGVSTFYLYRDIIEPLANDSRRFFRAFADETRNVIRNIELAYKAGPRGDEDSQVEAYEDVCEMHDAIMRVAGNRGLIRVPELIHDYSDACSGLTRTEMEFLASSKMRIFSSGGGNAVDNPVVTRAPGNSARVGAIQAVSGSNTLGADFD